MTRINRKIRNKSERTQQALLDAAIKIIGAKGYSAATVDEIVKEAGVSKGVAYYHFKNKEDIASYILQREYAVLISEFENIAEQQGTSKETLLQMLRAFATYLYNHKELAQFFSAEIWRNGRAWTDDVRGNAQHLIDIISQQLEKGQKQGPIRQHLDCSFAAASIVGMVIVDSMYVMSGEDKPTLTCDEFVERIFDFVHNAIIAK
ncbi:MAG: TetR/AcrR family transcriptional regulator [Eggerthellaceae bacterium]|nr:TetR/AcrR family transcriptional regulator [Eggerthellaceae bacterium]